LVKKKK